jgi:DNA-binding response OmpR family regulator
MSNILLLESDDVVGLSITRRLEEEGHKVYCAKEPQTALHLADKVNPSLVITEIALIGHSGFEFLYEFRSYSDWKSVPVIVYSSQLLDPKITNGTAWKHMRLEMYLYKPKVSTRQLSNKALEVLNGHLA